jgi:hypothetical protein
MSGRALIPDELRGMCLLNAWWRCIHSSWNEKFTRRRNAMERIVHIDHFG